MTGNPLPGTALQHSGDLDGAWAVMSHCGRYRYVLGRRWDKNRPAMVWLMLNPSTADAAVSDPTIRRCVGYAKTWGHGGILVLNLFALRATNPQVLHEDPDPVGPVNDVAIATLLGRPEDQIRIVAGWGGHGTLHGRAAAVTAAVSGLGHALWCLGVTSAGQPRHPLYLRADLPLVEYRGLS